MLVKFFNKKFIQKREPVKQILTKLPQHLFYQYHDMPYSFGRQWMYAGTKIIALCFFHQTGINVWRIVFSKAILTFAFSSFYIQRIADNMLPHRILSLGLRCQKPKDFIKETQNL